MYLLALHDKQNIRLLLVQALPDGRKPVRETTAIWVSGIASIREIRDRRLHYDDHDYRLFQRHFITLFMNGEQYYFLMSA